MTIEELKELMKNTASEVYVETESKNSEVRDKKILEAVQKLIGDTKGKDIHNADDAEKTGGYKYLSEFAYDVFKAGVGGSNMSPRLRKIYEKTAGDPSLQEGDSEQGGYLIPPEFSTNLMSIAIDTSEIIQRCMKIPIQRNSVRIPYISGFDHSSGLIHGNVKMYWVDELEEKTAKKPKFGQIQMNLHKLAGLCYASDEILEDSPITMEPLITRVFSDAVRFHMENVLINGTGAGQPQGILIAGCLVTVSKEVGQSKDTIVFGNLVKMYSRMWRKENMVWIANHDTFPQLASIVIPTAGGVGAPAWMPAGGISGKPYDILFGKPLLFTEHCQKLGDKGDIIACDWSQYLLGEKTGRGAGIQTATSIHLKFEYDQTAFRIIYRTDGQPWWPTALTPRYSSDTLSPFVTLAERDNI